MLGTIPGLEAVHGAGRVAGRGPVDRSGFVRDTCVRPWQRLARTGKNLTWPGGRRSGTRRNRNAARRHGGRDRRVPEDAERVPNLVPKPAADAAVPLEEPEEAQLPREPRGLRLAAPPPPVRAWEPRGARDGSAAASFGCVFGRGFGFRPSEPRDPAEPRDPFDSSVSRRLISIATGSSTELEWVFFSVTPSSGSMSRITFGFTSSSRASSLIRILTILCAPPSNSDTGVVRLNPAPYSEPPRLPEPLQFLS